MTEMNADATIVAPQGAGSYFPSFFERLGARRACARQAYPSPRRLWTGSTRLEFSPRWLQYLQFHIAEAHFGLPAAVQLKRKDAAVRSFWIIEIDAGMAVDEGANAVILSDHL